MRAWSLRFALLLFGAASPRAYADGGNLHRSAETKPIQLFHVQPSVKGTILMFHGFSEAPQHWNDEAKFRFDQGYDVLVAALPGHGFRNAAGERDTSRVPTATQSQKYTKFAQGMFDVARRRSDKVHVIGFSVGGAHALEVALAQADVRGKDGSAVLRSAFAISPYIGPNPAKIGPVEIDQERVMERADRMSFGLLGKALAHKPYVFGSAAKHDAEGRPDVGFIKVSYSNILGIGRFGDSVRARAASLKAPLQQPVTVLVTSGDPTADPHKGLAVAKMMGAKTIVLPINAHDPVLPEYDPDPAMRQRVRDAISANLEASNALK